MTVSNNAAHKIMELTKLDFGHKISDVYKENLRELIHVFSNLYYRDANNNLTPIKCYHSMAERAIAKLVQENNLVLPVVTISEISTSNNDERRRYEPILINEKYWDEKSQRAVRLLSLSPRAVDIVYEINILTKYKEDMDQIRSSIFSLFNPHLSLKTKYSNVNTTYIQSETDESVTIAEDKQNRILVKRISLTFEGYIPSPKFLYTNTGKIEQFNGQFELVELDDLITETGEVLSLDDIPTSQFTEETLNITIGQTPVIVGGGGGGARALHQLTDVDPNGVPPNLSLQDRAFLVWDAVSEKWKGLNPSDFGLSATQVSAVSGTSTLTVQQYLNTISQQLGNINLDSSYVDVSGDTMTGGLNIRTTEANLPGLNIETSGLTSTQAFSVRVPASSQRKAFGLLVIDEVTARVQFELLDNRTGYFCGPGGSGPSSIRDVGIYRDANKSLVLGTGTSFTPRLTVVSGGSIGIGTSSPSALLDVNGSAIANYLISRSFLESPIVSATTYLNLPLPDLDGTYVNVSGDTMTGSLTITQPTSLLTLNSTTANAPSILQLSSNITGNNVVGGKIDFNVTGGITYASIQAIQGASTGYGSLAFITRNAGVNSEKLRILADGSVSLGGINGNNGVTHGFIKDNGLVLVGNNSAANSNKTITYNAIVRTDGFWVNQSLPIGWIEPNAYSTDTTLRRVSPGVISAVSSVFATSAFNVENGAANGARGYAIAGILALTQISSKFSLLSIGDNEAYPIAFGPGGATNATQLWAEFRKSRLALNNSMSLSWTSNMITDPVDNYIKRISAGLLEVSSTLRATSALVAPLVSATTLFVPTVGVQTGGTITPDESYRSLTFSAITAGSHVAFKNMGLELGYANTAYSILYFGNQSSDNTPSLLYDGVQALAQRRGSIAQTFRLYNTYTSPTIFERANLTWASNTFTFGTEAGSAGGTSRNLIIATSGTPRMIFSGTGARIDAPVLFAANTVSATTYIGISATQVSSLSGTTPLSVQTYLDNLSAQVSSVGSGGAQLYIDTSAPTTTATKYLWIQTGLGSGGTDFTFWIEDGS